MTETLTQITFILIANCLFIHGLSLCFDPGNIFGLFDDWVNRTKIKEDLLRRATRNIRMHYQQRDAGMMAELIQDEDKKKPERIDNEESDAAREQLNNLKPRIPTWLQKPLYACSICMSSIYGTLGYFIGVWTVFGGHDLKTVIGWPFYVVMLAGLNAIIVNLYPVENE